MLIGCLIIIKKKKTFRSTKKQKIKFCVYFLDEDERLRNMVRLIERRMNGLFFLVY